MGGIHMGEHKNGAGGENRSQGLPPEGKGAIEFPYRDSARLLAAMRDQFRRTQLYAIDGEDRETAVERVWRSLALRRLL